MTIATIPQWWKGKDHRRIRGSRGQRFLSLRVHGVIFAGLWGLFHWTFRHDVGDDAMFTVPAPPGLVVPPPLPRSLAHTTTSEMPHLKSMEIEDRIPEHLPQKVSVDYNGLRQAQGVM